MCCFGVTLHICIWHAFCTSTAQKSFCVVSLKESPVKASAPAGLELKVCISCGCTPQLWPYNFTSLCFFRSTCLFSFPSPLAHFPIACRVSIWLGATTRLQAKHWRSTRFQSSFTQHTSITWSALQEIARSQSYNTHSVLKQQKNRDFTLYSSRFSFAEVYCLEFWGFIEHDFLPLHNYNCLSGILHLTFVR